ncbi:MAG TPA: YCF48-related protein [Ignavibacteria bacterium]|nr:YCF48-related protein [Ignavibacteria bacterium]
MRKYSLTFLFFFSVSLMAASAWAQLGTQYKWLHPFPQGNELRWIKMWNANNWYAIGFGGTFMKSTNGGTTWEVKTLVNGITETGTNNTCYDAYFFNQNTGYVCGGSGLVIKTTNGGNTWDSVTAVSSAVTWYDIDFINPNTGFVSGTTSGRAAVTTDGGATWLQMGTIPTGTYYSIYAKDVNNVIVTTTTGNIRKTTNGGANWTQISTGTSATLYCVEFLDNNTGYVCGSSSAIRYTTNFGDNWTSTNTGVASSTFYDIDFVNTALPPATLNEGFESVTFPPTGWTRESLLGTVQWVRSTTSPFAGTADAWSNFQGTGGIDWLITNSNTVYSGDSLSFWVRRSYTGASFDWDSLQVYAGISTDTTAMTSLLRIGVNDVDTSGSTYPPRLGAYQRFAISLNSFAGQNVYVGFRHSNFDGTGIRLDEVKLGENRAGSSANVYIIGNSSNVYKSTVGQDAFDTLQVLNNSQPWTTTFYSGDVSPSGDTITVSGGYGLINTRYSASNRVAKTNWIKAGIFYDIWAESTTGRVIAVGSPGIAGSVYDQVMYSTNGGQNWAIGNYSASDDQDLNSISMINATTGFVAGDEGVVSKTTNGGAAWTPTAVNPTTTELNKIIFFDANTGYVFGASGQGYKTINGGGAWNTLTTEMGTSVINGANFVNASTGWIVGASGKVYKTTNGGDNFVAQTSNYSGTLYSIYMINANTGWISAAGGHVRRTTDGGANWDSVNVPFNTIGYSVFFRDAYNGMVTGSSGRIFRTRDGGDTWEFDNTSGTTLYQVYMTATNRAFVCATNAAVWQYQETLTGIEGNFSNNIPDKYFLNQNYPNPFNPATTIRFGLPREGVVSLRIYDIAGREVANIFNNEKMNAGIIEYNFDASNLASGVYFYSLQVKNDFVATKKMVLVK